MHLYSFSAGNRIRVGAELNGRLIDLNAAHAARLGKKNAVLAPSMLEFMQDRTNEDWCFPLARLLEWFSVGITLEPDDVVTTGTPAGVGFFRKPQVFLRPGDICELEISGIGKLINRVVADEYQFPKGFRSAKT